MNSSPGRCVALPLSWSLSIFVFIACPLIAVSQPSHAGYFENFLTERYSSDAKMPAWNSEKFCAVTTSIVASRVLESYGAMFSAGDSVVLPSACIQPGESEVIKYQKTLQTKATDVNGTRIELQLKAMEALERAIDNVVAGGSRITPLDGAIAGRRSYGDTLMIWNSRYFPALDYWIRRGRLFESDRDAINRLDLQRKIERVLEWESKGIYFSTDRRRSILTSTAPPGTSQHLALIALDIVEYWDADVRTELNRNGWFQTIIDDPPHFTYLGVPESELSNRGLRAVAKGGFQFWVPNMAPKNLAP